MITNFPVMSISQFAVILCEIETGIVLNKDFEIYIGQGECFYVFNSLEKAESFCMKITKEKPYIESCIYSYDQSFIKRIVNDNYFKDKALKAEKKKKFWFF